MNPTAVIAHGAGSTADFIHRVFAGPLGAVGYELVSWDRRTPVGEAADEFAALVTKSRATLVGGVSVGAILATQFALSPVGAHFDGLLVALPPSPPQPTNDVQPETGPPPDIEALIDEVCRTAMPWVAQEIRASWPTYQPAALMRELQTASRAAPPTPAELARCRVPTGVVALAGDAVHPVEVATAWAKAIPRATAETVQLHEPAADVSVLGAAAVRAWQRARSR